MNSSVDEAQSLIADSLKHAVKNYTAQDVDNLIAKHRARHGVVSTEGLTLLHEAAQHRKQRQALEISQLLVKKLNLKAAEIDKLKQTAAFYAAKNGNTQLCEYLLQEGCEVDHMDMHQQTALFYAASNGHIGAAKVFLQHRANIDFKDRWGFTPIFWAAEADKVKMMRYLVDQGADTKLMSRVGGDIFTSARGGAMAYAVDELGADPKRRLTKNRTNLFVASKQGDLQKVRVCIESYGLDVNHIDENGQTCLFYAASSGAHAVTQKLLTKYGANALIEDAKGRTVMKYFEDSGIVNEKIHKLLSAAHKKQLKVFQAADKKRRAAALREEKEEKKRQPQQEKRRRQAEEKARLERQKAEERLREQEQQRAARTPAAASRSKRARSPAEPESADSKRCRFQLELKNRRAAVDRSSNESQEKLDELVQGKKRRNSRRNA